MNISLDDLMRKRKEAPALYNGAFAYGDSMNQWDDIIAEAHAAYPNVPKEIIKSVMYQESTGNAKAESPWNPGKGTAKGLMQMIDGTADEMGVMDVWDPRQNIFGGTKYLSQHIERTGSVEKALRRYHGGGIDVTGKRTSDYITEVMGRAGNATAGEGDPGNVTFEMVAAQRGLNLPVQDKDRFALLEPPYKEPTGEGALADVGEKEKGWWETTKSVVRATDVGVEAATDAMADVFSFGLTGLIPESEREIQQREEHPIAAQIGEVGGTLVSAIGGAQVAGKYLAGKIASPLLRGVVARGGVSGIVAAAGSVDDIVAGRRTVGEALKDVAQSAGGGVISIVPEVLAPAGVIQLLAQPLVDLAFDAATDKLRGYDVGSADWWKREALQLAMSTGFAVRDVAAGKTFKLEQAAMRADAKNKFAKVKDVFRPGAKTEIVAPKAGSVDEARIKAMTGEDVLEQKRKEIQSKYKAPTQDLPTGEFETRWVKDIGKKDPKTGQHIPQFVEAVENEVGAIPVQRRMTDVPQRVDVTGETKSDLKSEKSDILGKQEDTTNVQDDIRRSADVAGGGESTVPTGAEPGRLHGSEGGSEIGRIEGEEGKYYEDLIRVEEDAESLARESTPEKADDDWLNRDPDDIKRELDQDEADQLESGLELNDELTQIQQAKTDYDDAQFKFDTVSPYFRTIKPESFFKSGDRKKSIENLRWMSKKGRGVDEVRMDFIADNRQHLAKLGTSEDQLQTESDFLSFLETIPLRKDLPALKAAANRKPKYTSPKAIKKRRELAQQKLDLVAPGAGTDAAVGRFAARQQDLDLSGGPTGQKPGQGGEPPGVKEPQFMELPEVVELAKALNEGRAPKVKEVLRAGKGQALGVAKGTETEVRADQAEDIEQATKTLSHEIGHVVNNLPEEMKRGNILGEIASLKKYLKTTLDELPRDVSQALEAKDRRRIRRLAEREVGPRPGKDEEADLAAWREEVKEVNDRKIREEMDRRGLITRDEVMGELKAVTQKWRPFDEAADAKFTKYRHKPKELYADAFSVFLNEPALLDRMAPRFYRSLLGYMDRKPGVKAAYDKIQKRIGTGSDAVLEARQKAIREGRAEAEEKFKKRAEKSLEQKMGFWEGMVKSMSDEHVRLGRTIKKVERKIGRQLVGEENPLTWIEQNPYQVGQQYSYKREVENNVAGLYRSKGLTDDDMADYMKLRRNATELKDKFGTGGVQGKFADQQLAYMKKKMGAEKFGALEKAANEYWKIRQNTVIKALKESNTFDAATMKKIEENENYATRMVSKFIDETGTSGRGVISPAIKKVIGSLEGTANDFHATIMKDAVLMRAAHRTMGAKSLTDFMLKYDPDNIKESKKAWNATVGAKTYVETRDPDMKTIIFKQDGKEVAYDVEKEMAHSFETAPRGTHGFTKFMMSVANPFKMFFTQKNPIWIARNIIRDALDSWTHLTKISFGKLMGYYGRAAGDAYQDVYKGVSTPDVKKMYEENMLVVGRTWKAKELLSADTEHERMLMNLGLGTAKYQRKVWKPFQGLMNGLSSLNEGFEKAALFTERVGKIAGYKYLSAEESERGIKQIANLVRTGVGTPDALRGGAARALYNNLWMFSNMGVQGYRAGIDAARESPTRFAYKQTVSVVLPKVLQFAAGAGAAAAIPGISQGFSDKLKEWYGKIPEHDLTRYHCVPFTETKNGRVVYFVIPQGHLGQAIGGMTRKAMKMAMEGREDEITDWVRFAKAEIPYSGLNPVASIVSNWAQFLAGINPIDDYRGSRIVNEKKFEGGFKTATPEMLRHSAAQAGGSIYLKLDGNNVDQVATSFEKLYGIPIVGRMLNAFIRVSDAGEKESLARVGREARRKEVQSELKYEGKIVKHFNKLEGAPKKSEARALHKELKKEGYAKEFGQFWSRYQNIAIGKYGTPEMKAISHAASKKAKEAIADKILEGEPDLTDSQRKAKRKKLLRRARMFKELAE